MFVLNYGHIKCFNEPITLYFGLSIPYQKVKYLTVFTELMNAWLS